MGDIGQHAGLFVSGAVLLLTGLKVLVVSHGDLMTAAGIIDAQGWTILPSVVLSSIWSVGTLPLGIAYVWVAARVVRGAPVGKRTVLLILSTLSIAVLFAPRDDLRALFVGMVCMAPAIIVARRARRRTVQRPRRDIGIRSLIVAYAAVAILFLPAISTRVWLPAETIVLDGGADEPAAGGNELVAGYVLGEAQSNAVAILTLHDRKVLHVEASVIKARWLCVSDESQVRRPLIASLLSDGPIYPACASSPHS